MSKELDGALRRACQHWLALEQQGEAFRYLESTVPVADQQAFAERWRRGTRPQDEWWLSTAQLLWARLARTLSARASAAIAGNAAYESDLFRADTEYSGGGGRGWLQWTGTRRAGFEAWAKMKGYSCTSLEANAGYILHELSGADGNHWSPGKSRAGLEAEATIEDASNYFCQYYLRPATATANMPARADLSTQVLAAVVKKGPGEQAPIDLTQVPVYYDALPWQDEALDWLEAAIKPPVLAEFLRLWRSAPVMPLCPAPTRTTIINWANNSQQIARHFTVVEVTKGSAERRPIVGSQEELNILRLADRLDRVRDKWGPIAVTSWYRPPAVNAAVGGVVNSTHILGLAADIAPLDADPIEFENWLDQNWVGGVGYGQRSGRGFTHVNLPAATQGYQHRVRWDY